MEEDSKADTYSSEDNADDEPLHYYFSENATHLLELSSISIRCDRFNKFPHDQLFCHVSLIADNGTTFTLLDEECRNDALSPRDDFFEIPLGKSEPNLPRLLPKHFFIKLILKDNSRETVIIDEYLYWDFSGNVVYDERQCFTFNIKGNGNVKVCYTIFRYALFAYLDFKVVKNEQDDDLHALVSGNITATSKLWNRSVLHVLFDKPHSGKTMLPSTELCWTSCFPVPAYSPLKINANLEINNEIIGSGEDGLEIEAMDNFRAPYKKEIKGKKWRIVVKVTMTHAIYVVPEDVMRAYYNKFDKKLGEGLCISHSESSSMPGEELDATSLPECGKVGEENESISDSESSSMSGEELDASSLHVELPVSAKCSERIDRFRFPRHRFLRLVELFSISACPYVNGTDKLCDPFHLYGTIKIDDVLGDYDIFNRDKKYSALSHPHATIPLVYTRRCYMGSHFTVQLDLKDDKGREISQGIMSWNLNNAEKWCNKRICSVVPGRDGFAAIHYIMFSDAVQAKVKVSISSIDGRACLVGGKIWAKYCNKKYSTLYEKKYYQSVLFEKRKSNVVKLLDGVDLPLLKSVVPVPFGDMLVVKFDLYILVADRKELLKGKVLFKPRESEEPKLDSRGIIGGPSGEVSGTVSVEWG